MGRHTIIFLMVTLLTYQATVSEMTARPVDFWLRNVEINNNVLATAHMFRAWCGPIRVVSELSTAMLPRDVGAAQWQFC